MAEIIDIFDADLRPLGKMDRIEAHMKGHWHKTFHCSVVSAEDGGKILFQLRSKEMVNFPDMFDISAAGHLEAGEQVEEGIREVTEELGIPITFDMLHFLGYRVEVADQANGQKNREYQAVYIIKFDSPLSDYKPQVKEIAGLFWIGIADGMDLFSGKTKQADMNGIVYNKEKQYWENIKRPVSIDDFLPRIQNYYLTLCIMGERLLEGKFPLSIS